MKSEREREKETDPLITYAFRYGGQVSFTLDCQVTHYVGTEVPLWLRRLLLHDRKSPTLFCQFLNPTYFLHCIEHNTRLSTVEYVLPLAFEFLHYPCNEPIKRYMPIVTLEKKLTCTNIENCTEPMLTSSENPNFVYGISLQCHFSVQKSDIHHLFFLKHESSSILIVIHVVRLLPLITTTQIVDLEDTITRRTVCVDH
jgi:hypothetical protein